MDREKWRRFNEFSKSSMAWTYSLSFPLGFGVLIFARVYFWHRWEILAFVGLMTLGFGVYELATGFLVRRILHGNSLISPRQEICWALWLISSGVWLRWRPLNTVGLAFLIVCIGLPLWALSHREVLRLRNRQEL